MHIQSLACVGVLLYPTWYMSFSAMYPTILGYATCFSAFSQCRKIFCYNTHVYNAQSLAYRWECKVSSIIYYLRHYQFIVYLYVVCYLTNIAIWDLFMDWSLMQPHAPHPFLRHDLGYKRYWVSPFRSTLMKGLLRCHCDRPDHAVLMVILRHLPGRKTT
jgi:hypothetical protein